MRRFWSAAALVLMISAAAAPVLAQVPAAAPATGLSVTLLGTAGGPPPHTDRAQPASLLRVDGKTYLIDAGQGVAQQLVRAGAPPAKVTAGFITHLHWDHTLGLGYLMAVGWMTNRTQPMPLIGPPGLSEFVARETAAVMQGEEIFRAQNPERPALRGLYPAKDVDVSAPRAIYADDKVRVTAVLNSHFEQTPGPPHSYGVDKSYSYRFDTAHGSVVFTGDTGPSEAVTDLARGADVLVTEICDFDSIRAALLQTQGPGANIDALLAHMAHQHLSAQAVGEMAAKAGVKTVVLTHYVIGRGFDPQAFAAQVRRFYPVGEIVVGQDLLRVPVEGQPSPASPSRP